MSAVLEWEAPVGQDKPREVMTATRVEDKLFRVENTTAGPAQMVDLRWVVENAAGTSI